MSTTLKVTISELAWWQREAKKMLTGKVERITQKGVIIGVDEKYRNERWLSSNHVVRKSECFVIVFKKED